MKIGLLLIFGVFKCRYLAPEYVNGGKIAQKVDVHAFGVVLLELMTGQRTSKLQHYKGHLCAV